MTLVNCTVDKLLVLALITNYVTNCSIIITTPHIPNIPRPKHPTSRTFHNPIIPYSQHTISPIMHITRISSTNFRIYASEFLNIHSTTVTGNFRSQIHVLSLKRFHFIVNIFGRVFRKSTIRYNDIEKEILAKGSKGKYWEYSNTSNTGKPYKRLRDISKRTDLQISETSPVRCIKDVSSETSLRSLRSSQRRL